MKKPALLLFLISLMSLKILAQTKQITNSNRLLGIREQYTVLKSNKEFREGKYTASNFAGDKLFCEGLYKENRKTGIWNGYNYNGELQVQYDYTNKSLLFYKSNKYNSNDRPFNIINNSDTLKASLDHSPVYLDGEMMMGAPIAGTIRYPAAAREKNIQGVVLIALTIDTTGHISNYRIKKSVGFGCDEEALKAVKKIDGDWIPGVYQGKAVITEYDIPVSFTLANN
jgi:TonB family protein